MMSIVLFQEITTEQTLLELEANGEKYKDLYVDMDEKEQRKYVKDSAALINGMLKKLDRARIDKSKEYKQAVEAEAKSIRERLEAANEPFTALIDAHNAERKKILDDKRAKEAAIELAKQIESDHEIGLLLNDKFDSEKDQREADRIAAQKAHDERVAAAAIEQEKHKTKLLKEAENREQERRLADKEHKRAINRAVVSSLISESMITEQQAKMVLTAIYEGAIPHVTINY